MTFIKVDMTTQDVTAIEVPEQFAGFGGRELTAHFIHDQIPPACDPRGAENNLIMAAGILSGTSWVNTGRLSIGAKSPLTGGVKESNDGGPIAHHLARMNVAAITMEGQPKGGFASKDDRLPDFFYREPLPPHKKVVQITGDAIDRTFDF